MFITTLCLPPQRSQICLDWMLFSHSVVSDSLQPHGLQHTRLPCPSPSPKTSSNSCLLSQWCHPTISSSVVPFSCLQHFPALGSSPVNQFFTSSGQNIGASVSVLPMSIQGWFPLEWTGWISLQSQRLSRAFSRTTDQKHQFFVVLSSLWSNSHIHTWLLEWKNNKIVILCSSWVENKRVMSCHAWKKLCHRLLLLVYFADVDTKAHQVARGTHRANRAELEWYSYLFPKFLIKALSSTTGRGYSTSSSKFTDSSKASPPPPWAHHGGPESCQLFLDVSCRLQGSLFQSGPLWHLHTPLNFSN